MIQATLSVVDKLVAELTPDDQLALVERIVQRARAEKVPPTTKPKSLYGIWKGKFPEDADIDEAIHEARTGWMKDMEILEGE